MSEKKDAAAPTGVKVQLPSGLTVYRQKLKGNDFFRWQAMAAKELRDKSSTESTATQWIMLHAYHLESGPLTIDTLDEMDFCDVSAINTDVAEHFLSAAPVVAKS